MDFKKNLQISDWEKKYLDLMLSLLAKENLKYSARENMPATKSKFGEMISITNVTSFPILISKKVNFNNILAELLWFLNGETNVKHLIDAGCNIWNEDSYNFYRKNCVTNNINALSYDDYISFIKDNDFNTIEKYSNKTFKYNVINNYILGDCGIQYGKLWRGAYTKGAFQIDQIEEIINSINFNPESRRHIVSAWNPNTLSMMALPACHLFYQISCEENTHLDMNVYLRSSDIFLGLPYNISSYYLLLMLIAKFTNKKARNLNVMLGDVHIYENLIESCRQQIENAISYNDVENPILNVQQVIISDNLRAENVLDRKIDISTFIAQKHIELVDYKSLPAIKGKLSTGLVK